MHESLEVECKGDEAAQNCKTLTSVKSDRATRSLSTAMARKKIREYSSKLLLKAHLARLSGTELPIQAVQVTSGTNFRELVQDNAWLRSTKLVVKPDMLFGKRGKHDLVGLNLSITEVCKNFTIRNTVLYTV